MNIEESAKNAFAMMRKAGFEIKNSIGIAVDENLPFMGYTSGTREEHLIVVSGMATRSELLEGLLVHEMCHIYRTETMHPSHDPKLLSEVIDHIVREHGLTREYQLRILHQVVNHIQDLYADDIAFKVFEESEHKLFPLERIRDFFLGWIRIEPVELGDESQESWMNAATMLNNAFAMSNMERHGVEDIDGKAENLNKQFLTKANSNLSKGFDYFIRLMTHLEEDVSEEDFRKILREYLDHFVRLTNA